MRTCIKCGGVFLTDFVCDECAGKKQAHSCSDHVAIRRGLLTALILTASALCRKVTPERIAHCREILRKIDEEVFDPTATQPKATP